MPHRPLDRRRPRLTRRLAVVTILVLLGSAIQTLDAGAAEDATIRIRQQDPTGATVPGGCWRASALSGAVDRCDDDDGATDGLIVLSGLASGDQQLHQTVSPDGHRSAPDRGVALGAGQVLDVTTTHAPFPVIRVTTTVAGVPIGGSCWTLRRSDQTEGGIDFCDESDGTTDGTASAPAHTTGDHVLFHTRGPSGYELVDPTAVSVVDDDVVLGLELTPPPPPTAPVELVAPTVAGTARVGARLTADPGTWSGSPSYTYQWQRCSAGPDTCLDLPGQTATTYTAQLADADRTLRVVVTATNPQGASTVASAPTAPIDDAPVPGSPPAVTGRTLIGSTLSATSGTWLSYYGTPTFAFDWQRCDATRCRSIGDRASTHLLTDADVGARMRVVVTATDRGGVSTSTSAQTGTVVTTGPRSVDRPVITGNPYVAQTWSATPGVWSGEGRVTIAAYQWERCGVSCAAIPGATGRTYKTTKADGGSRLRVVVTASNSTGRATAASDTSAPIEARTPVVVSPPTVSGLAVLGGKLTANRGTWFSPIGNLSFGYVWMRCSDAVPVHCDLIPGATSTTYTVTRADVGYWIRMRVDASNPDGTTPAVTPLTAQVKLRPPINVSGPVVTGVPRNGYQLSGTTGEWTSAAGPLRYRYQWERCAGDPLRCETIAGATQSTYVVTTADERWTLRLVVQARNDDADAVAFSNVTDTVVLHRPVMLTAPRVLGTPRVGQQMQVDPGTWTSAAGPLRYRYRWGRVQPDSDRMEYISGATSATYKPTKEDVGFRLRVFVTVDNMDGWEQRPTDISAVVQR